jgi:hypothetical protein
MNSIAFVLSTPSMPHGRRIASPVTASASASAPDSRPQKARECPHLFSRRLSVFSLTPVARDRFYFGLGHSGQSVLRLVPGCPFVRLNRRPWMVRQVAPGRIMVVATYSAQVNALGTALSREVRVATVDKFQAFNVAHPGPADPTRAYLP